MTVLRVHDVFQQRALVTRDSARKLAKALAGEPGDEDAVADFAGIEAVTPSFVDELLGSVLREWAGRELTPRRLVFTNVPTRLSLKFAAIGRARSIRIEEEREGTWVITA